MAVTDMTFNEAVRAAALAYLAGGGGGGGAGTSNTTEATQLLVKTAVETTATNSTALAKSEDVAHASGDKGIMALVVRKDTAAALAGADGDYAPLEVDASGRLWVNVGAMAALPAGANNIGDVDVATLPALVAGSAIIGKVGIDQTTPGTTNAVVMKTSAGTEVNFADPTTGTGSQVASSASAVTILAANTSRKGATVFNDSTQVLYLILSNTTPTSAVYTVKMAAGSYYEVPAGYNGIIKGIWASANGNAVITELS